MWWLSPLLGLAGVVVGTVATYLLGRRKANADAEYTISQAASSIAEAADAQLKRMTGWLAQAQAETDAARAEIVLARATMNELRIEAAMWQEHVRSAEAELVTLRATLEAERAASRLEIARLVAQQKQG